MAHTFGTYVVQGKRHKLEQLSKVLLKNCGIRSTLGNGRLEFEIRNTYEFGIMDTGCRLGRLKYQLK